eukprot:6894833-Ditylum_brightwellii.AAC.1
MDYNTVAAGACHSLSNSHPALMFAKWGLEATTNFCRPPGGRNAALETTKRDEAIEGTQRT